MISSQKKQPIKSSGAGSMIELHEEDLPEVESDLTHHSDFEIDLIEVEDHATHSPILAVPIFSTRSKHHQPSLSPLHIDPLGRSFTGKPTFSLSRSLIMRPDLERSHMFQRPPTFSSNPDTALRWLQTLDGHQGAGRLSFLDLGIWFRVCDAHIQSGPLRHARLAFEVGDGAPIQTLIRTLNNDPAEELNDFDSISQQSPDLVLHWISTALLTLTRWTHKSPILLNYGVNSCEAHIPRWSTHDISRPWRQTSSSPPTLIAQAPSSPAPSSPAPSSPAPSSPAPSSPAPSSPAPSSPPALITQTPSLTSADLPSSSFTQLFDLLTPQAQLSITWVNDALHAVSCADDPSLIDQAKALAQDLALSLHNTQLGGRALFSTEKSMVWIGEDTFWLGLFTPSWSGMLRLPNAKMGFVFSQLKGA
jgi:hypothetical protein